MHIIAGLYKNRRLNTPKNNLTRPTSSKLRESIFNICQHSIEDSVFLDLFAGSGAMGLEALSRGASKALFVDVNRQAVNCIKENVAQLKVEKQCEIFCGQVFALLKLFAKQNRQFDFIYADPPYNTSVDIMGQVFLYSEYVVHSLDSSHLLAPNGTLIVEEDARHPPTIIPTHLVLEDSRKFGHSLIQIYKKIS